MRQFCFLCLVAVLLLFPVRALAARVSMNTGTEAELLSIPYTTLTPDQARSIIGWRNEHGPFKTPEDVKQAPGMTDLVWGRLSLVVAPDGDVVWDPDLEEADEEQPPQMHGY